MKSPSPSSTEAFQHFSGKIPKERKNKIEDLRNELATMCVAVIDLDDPPSKYTYKALSIMNREQIEIHTCKMMGQCVTKAVIAGTIDPRCPLEEVEK